MNNRWRWPSTLILSAIFCFCLLNVVASAQQSGTVLRETLTFRAQDTAAVEFNVTGKPAGDMTLLTLEFGRDGFGATSDPVLPSTARLIVSMTLNNVTTTLSPFASTDIDVTQTFGSKSVRLRRNAPDLYELSVTHGDAVPQRTTEMWKVEVAGLPQTGLRGIAFLRGDTFKSVSPVGACIGPASGTGTALRQAVTFFGAGAPAMDINVAAGIARDTLTTLLLELNPDGTASPGSTALTSTTRFKLSTVVNGQIVPLVIDPNAQNRVQQFPNVFPNKTIHLTQPRRGFFRLSVEHRQDVATTETWRLEISALPRTLRAVGAALNGTFRSLSPLAPCVEPRISISRPIVAAGPSRLEVAASEGFDLSNVPVDQVKIVPPDGVSDMAISNATAQALTLSFNLASNARVGTRTLSITANNVAASDKFNVVGISASRSTVATGTSRLDINASDGLDLSNVRSQQVRITPPGDVSNITVSNATARRLMLSFDLAPSAQLGKRTLTVDASNVSASTDLNVVGINIAQPIVGTGPSRLEVVSSEGFDLSGIRRRDVKIDPPDDISNIAVSKATPSVVSVSFDVAGSAQVGKRALAITMGNVSVSTKFNVVGISIAQSIVAAGPSRLEVASSEGFDLSNVRPDQVKVSPPYGISDISVSNATARGLALSFNVASNAPAVDRDLTITANNVRASTKFKTIAISISPPGVIAIPPFSEASTLRITSSEGFNLSSVGPGRVSFSPATGLSNLAFSNQSERGLTLSFNLAPEAPTGDRDVKITANNVSASAKFKVIGIRVSPDRVETGDFADLRIISSDGFNLSKVGPGQIRISGDGIRIRSVSDQTEHSLKLSLGIGFAASTVGFHRLTITVNNVSASNSLFVDRPEQPMCTASLPHCCDPPRCDVCVLFSRECPPH